MLKIVPRGVLKDHFPSGLKRGWSLDTDRIPEALSALNQIMDWDYVSTQHRWIIRAAPNGKPYSRSKRLTIAQAKFKRFADPTTIWIEDSLSGEDPGTLTVMAINAAMTLATMGLQMLFKPKASEGKNKTGVQYGGGNNTSIVGAAQAYLAGLKVPCGSQIIEAMIKSLRGAGGASGYVDDVPGTLPGGGGDGGGTNPGVNPRTDWVDTGTWQWDDIYDTAMGASGGGGRRMAETGQTYAQVSALLCPGSGRTDGPAGDTIQEKETNILLDGVPLRDPGTGQYNFQGVRWTYRPGEIGQSPIGLLPGIPSSYDKSGGELTKSNPAGVPIAVNDPRADFVEALIRCRLGWTSDKGNEKPDYMTLRFEVKRENDPDWRVSSNWNSGELRNLTGFDTDIHIAAPPPAEDPDEPWRIRVIRTRDDEPDTSRTREASVIAWTEYRALDYSYDGSLGHPPAALLAIQQQAVEDGRGNFPEVTVLWSGREVRVPNNYDPVEHTYTGAWNGGWDYKATENPVWLWLDMMTATDGMGLGVPLSTIDKFKLYPQAQYCDQLIGGKPRWTCNKQFSDEKPFWEAITEFCKSFRAVPYFNGAEYYLSMEMPGLPVPYYINNDGVVDGLFELTTTDSETHYNSVEVEYDEPAKRYEKSSVTWTDEENIEANADNGETNLGIVSTLVHKTGCTDGEEAWRLGQRIGWCALNEIESYTFKTTMEGVSYCQGERIEIHDWVINGTTPIGRVLSVPNANEFDIPVPMTFLAGVQYKLHAQVGLTHITRDLPILSTTQTRTRIALNSHGLVEDAPIGIIDATGVSLWQGIIRNVEEDEPGIFSVTCQQWIEEKFAAWDGDGYEPPVTFPVVNRQVGPPREVIAEAHCWIDETDRPAFEVKLNWQAPASGTVTGYVVRHRAPSGAWRIAAQPTATFVNIPVDETGLHRFTVQAVNLWSQSLPVPASTNVGEDDEFVRPILKSVA